MGGGLTPAGQQASLYFRLTDPAVITATAHLHRFQKHGELH